MTAKQKPKPDQGSELLRQAAEFDAPAVDQGGDPPPTDTAPAPDPFDVSSFRLDQNFLETAGVKKLLTTVPVRKPHKQEYVRVHSAAEYRENMAILELKDERETYLLAPNIARSLPGEFSMCTLYTAINRQGVVFLWPVKLPGQDGKVNAWHVSGADAAERCFTGWYRVKANLSLGAYELYQGAPTIPDPEWPTLSFNELVQVAFKDRLVTSLQHPIVGKLLRGD
jgi:hypothetical protein